MLLYEWLNSANKLLKFAGIHSFFIDSLILCEYVTNQDRSYLIAHSKDYVLENTQICRLDKLLDRRLKHEPIAYITKKCYFYGHSFVVDGKTLIPKPESEAFIDLLEQVKNIKNYKTLLDIGTGTGCLAISAKIKYPHLSVAASDKYSGPLKLAENNSKMHKTNIKFVKSNFITNKIGSLDIIFANLPYVPYGYKISKESEFEPKSAIYADNNGIENYIKLAPLAKKSLNRQGLLFIESLPEQQDEIESIFSKYQMSLVSKKGLVSYFINL